MSDGTVPVIRLQHIHKVVSVVMEVSSRGTVPPSAFVPKFNRLKSMPTG